MGWLGLRVHVEEFKVKTKGPFDVVNITGLVKAVVDRSGIRNGLVHVFSPHTTVAFALTEDEEGLREDMRDVLRRLVPPEGPYRHPINAHSHIISMLLAPDRTIPLVEGRLALGTWQSLLLVEADTHGRDRRVVVQVMGE